MSRPSEPSRPDRSTNRLSPRLYSLGAGARYLGVSYWTLREIVWRGDLPSLRIGRRILLDLKDLDRFIETKKESSQRFQALTAHKSSGR